MISEELSAWLVARREVLDWSDQVALISLAAQAGDDDAFVAAAKDAGPTLTKAVSGYDEALFKVGPGGYSHGWVKVGAVSPGDLRVEHKGALSDKVTLRHTGSGTVLAKGTHYRGADKGYHYSLKHADGTDLGKFQTMTDGRRAVADYHNGKYGAANKVGPKGYIHGWIKVGGAADSLDLHTDDAGKLTPKRAALHSKIVNDTLAGHEGKDKPVATFLGGGPASGKSTVMKDVGDQLVVDPDGIKAKLPEYQKMVKNGDKRAASFAHEESSHLAKRTMEEAAKKKLDFTLDGTGDSGYDKMAKKVATARKHGHQIDAKYVTVDTDEAVRRATKRAQRTGRLVPETTIRATHAAVSRTFKQAIDHNLFDTAELWDNNGREPKLIGRKLADGPFQVHDRAAWESFLAKGQEA